MSAKEKKPAAPKAAKSPAPKKKAPDIDTSDPLKPAYEQLTPAHQRFVDEYIVHFNATKAWLAVPGVSSSEAAARSTASTLLTKPNIQRAIQERIAASGERSKLEVTKDRILQEIARLAFFDIRKLYREDGTMKNPDELDDDTAAALSEFTIHEMFEGYGDERELVGFAKKAKPYDKGKHLEMLMKHLGLLKEEVTVGVTSQVGALLGALAGGSLPVRAKPDED